MNGKIRFMGVVVATMSMISGSAWAQQGPDAGVFVAPPAFGRIARAAVIPAVVPAPATTAASFTDNVRACFRACPQSANVCTNGNDMQACLNSQVPACATLRSSNLRAMNFMSTICGNVGFVPATAAQPAPVATPPRRSPEDLCRTGRHGSADPECVRCVSRGRGWRYARELSDGATALMRAGVSEFDTRCVFVLAGPMLPVIGALARRTEEVATQAGTANRLGGENAVAIAGVLRLMYRQQLSDELDRVRHGMNIACRASVDGSRRAESPPSFDPTVLWSEEDRERHLGVRVRPSRSNEPSNALSTCESFRAEVMDMERTLDQYGGPLVVGIVSRANGLVDRILTSCASGSSERAACVEAQRELATVLRPQVTTPAAPVAAVSP